MTAIEIIFLISYIPAVARVTRLVNRDTITDWLRIWWMKRHPATAYFLACPWCVSVWVAAGLGYLLWHETRLPWLLIAFVGAGASYVTGLVAQLDAEDITIEVERDDDAA